MRLCGSAEEQQMTLKTGERWSGRLCTKDDGTDSGCLFSASKIAWILDHVTGAREKAEAGDLLLGRWIPG